MRTLGINQLMAASLYGDEAQLDSFRTTLVREWCRARELTLVGDVRTAFSFGQLVHANDCGRELVVDHGNIETVGECSEDCVIMPCDEADASVVMMRVEFDVDEPNDQPVEASHE